MTDAKTWSIFPVPSVDGMGALTVIVPEDDSFCGSDTVIEDVVASHRASGADVTLPDSGFMPADALAVVGTKFDSDGMPNPARLGDVRVNRYVPSLDLVRTFSPLRRAVLDRQRGLVPALTESCDLACRMCPFYGCDIPEDRKEYYRDYMHRRQGCGHASKKDFLRWVDMFRPFLGVGGVSVYGPGEPFLHPDAVEVLSACNQRGLFVNFATNGNRFDQAQLDALKEGKVGVIIFSLDALTAETYGRIKPSGDFARITGALEELLQARDGGSGMRISVSFIRQEYNKHEEEAFVTHWAARADDVVVTSKYHAGIPESEPSFTPHALLPCSHLENSVHVLSNGDCWTCSAGVPDEFFLGNADADGPEAVLAALDGYVNKRIDTGEGGELCRKCLWWRQTQRIETWSGGKVVRVDQPYSYRVVGKGAR